MKYIAILALPLLLFGCSGTKGISESTAFAEKTVDELCKDWSFETLRPRLAKPLLKDEQQLADIHMILVMMSKISGGVESIKKENSISTNYNVDFGKDGVLKNKYEFDVQCKNGLVNVNLETSQTKDKLVISELKISAPSMQGRIDKLNRDATEEAKEIAIDLLTNWSSDIPKERISKQLFKAFPDANGALEKMLQAQKPKYGKFEKLESVIGVESTVPLEYSNLQFDVDLLARCSKNSAKISVSLVTDGGELKLLGVGISEAKVE